VLIDRVNNPRTRLTDALLLELAAALDGFTAQNEMQGAQQ